MSLPRVLVAAPASGHGKTTVATGLMAALADRGHVVSGHKVGPDTSTPDTTPSPPVAPAAISTRT